MSLLSWNCYADIYGTTDALPNRCYLPNNYNGSAEIFVNWEQYMVPECMALADIQMKRKSKSANKYYKAALLPGCITKNTVGEAMLCQQLYSTYMRFYLEDKIYSTPLKSKSAK